VIKFSIQNPRNKERQKKKIAYVYTRTFIHGKFENPGSALRSAGVNQQTKKYVVAAVVQSLMIDFNKLSFPHPRKKERKKEAMSFRGRNKQIGS